MLGYTNSQKAIRDHVDEEGKLTERIVQSGQHREVAFINESGRCSHPHQEDDEKSILAKALGIIFANFYEPSTNKNYQILTKN